jgi:hypothetical protein
MNLKGFKTKISEDKGHIILVRKLIVEFIDASAHVKRIGVASVNVPVVGR